LCLDAVFTGGGTADGGNCLDAHGGGLTRDRARFTLSEELAEIYKKRGFVPKSFGGWELGVRCECKYSPLAPGPALDSYPSENSVSASGELVTNVAVFCSGTNGNSGLYRVSELMYISGGSNTTRDNLGSF
jgi:hypothetical protein